LGTEIYLSFAHRAPNELFQLQQKVIEMGLVIQEILPRFNYYEGSDILANVTQMIRLIRTEHASPMIKPDTNYSSAIYTGEISPKIRFYYCNACRKLIELSNNGPIQSIEQLKNQGCPFCKSKGPFDLEEKISEP
jgi:N4-bis(aminopropyl)spermidine synthase